VRRGEAVRAEAGAYRFGRNRPHRLNCTRVYLPLVMQGARRPTSDELIEQALARGEIDSETALTYEVFAAVGDARLPAGYQGLVDSHIVAEVLARYDGLSAATQAIVNPFLIPPAYEGSWVEPLPAAAGLAPQAARSQPPPCGALAWPDWTYRSGTACPCAPRRSTATCS